MTVLPLFPEGVRCENCQHWGDPESWEDGRAYCSKLDETPMVEMLGPGLDGNRPGVAFTHADFGCRLWEPIS